MTIIDTQVKTLLSDDQIRYWKDPEKMRAKQRAKYKRYPEKIKAINKAWQEKNKEHFKTLIRFGVAICTARKKGNLAKVSLLCAAREEYKKQHRHAVNAQARNRE